MDDIMNKGEEILTPKFMCSCGNYLFNCTETFDSGEPIKATCPSCGKKYYKDGVDKDATIIIPIKQMQGNMAELTRLDSSFTVGERGIYRSVAGGFQQLIISREAFIEAYRIYIEGR